MMSSNYTHVVAIPGRSSVIDCIDLGTGRTMFSDETPDQVAIRHPGAVLMTLEAYRDALHAAWEGPPVEIDADVWMYALECLPPVAWTHRGGVESFKMSERITDDITNCYVRIGERHFELPRRISTSHDELALIVREHIESFA